MLFALMSFVSWQLPVFFGTFASILPAKKPKNPFPAVFAGLRPLRAAAYFLICLRRYKVALCSPLRSLHMPSLHALTGIPGLAPWWLPLAGPRSLRQAQGNGLPGLFANHSAALRSFANTQPAIGSRLFSLLLFSEASA